MHQMITLPNGVRILTELVPTVRSAALGIWVGTGARHESAQENGAAHFIEHLVFKGTPTRTAAEIAQDMDAIGGQVNAFTTKECTCFYVRALDVHLSQATDILCDMVFHSKFDDSDVDLERGVIFEEIGMYEDTPEDLTAENLFGTVFPDSPLGRPILGTQETLEKMTGAFLKEYQRTHYLGGNTVVSLVGSFSQQDLEQLTERFSQLPAGTPGDPLPATYCPAVTVKEKDIEQNHLTLAFPGLPYGSEERYVLQLLSAILGSGMSSRLFQQVREQQGLCYSIYSYGAGHDEIGLFSIYTALSKDTEEQALDTILQAVRTFVQEGPTEEELNRVREQSKANVLMGLESTQALMSHLGRAQLLTGTVPTLDQIIAEYDKVTVDAVRSLAQRIFQFSQMSLSAVGRVKTAEAYTAILNRV